MADNVAYLPLLDARDRSRGVGRNGRGGVLGGSARGPLKAQCKFAAATLKGTVRFDVEVVEEIGGQLVLHEEGVAERPWGRRRIERQGHGAAVISDDPPLLHRPAGRLEESNSLCEQRLGEVQVGFRARGRAQITGSGSTVGSQSTMPRAGARSVPHP